MFRLRESPEDFRVEEIPLYPATGTGDHTFVLVEKRMRTTEEVARDLARASGVHPRDIGYAGRKDRRAVTTQWLSVPGLAPRDALAFSLPGATVLEAIPHPHKLRTGHLRGNRFGITVRGVDPRTAEEAAARLATFVERGMPNRFGPQRFGRDGDNAERALALLRGERVRGGRRDQRFLLSALQAVVFNEVLDARPVPIDALEYGDVAMRHESGGVFVVEDPEREAPRVAAFEISATGPIFGTKMPMATAAVGARERAALATHGIDLETLRPPRGIRLHGARRPLRVRPEAAEHAYAGDALHLRFTLPAGSYATVLVDALLGTPGDPAAAFE